MKKLVLLSVLFGAMPITMMAQDDDLYFVPTKENVAKEAEKYGMPTDTYYVGSTRSTDEYNRRAWSRVAPIDSAGNDIIDFSAERGVYPDSAYKEVQDYKYTRRMSRFDDYNPSVAYWEGYRDGRWSSPWYYSGYYSWYDPWYDVVTMAIMAIGDGVHLITIPHGIHLGVIVMATMDGMDLVIPVIPMPEQDGAVQVTLTTNTVATIVIALVLLAVMVLVPMVTITTVLEVIALPLRLCAAAVPLAEAVVAVPLVAAVVVAQ